MESTSNLQKERTLSGNYRLVLVIAVTLVIAVHLWSVMRFPAPHVDEAWLASKAWALMQTGRAFGPLDAGVFDRLEGYWTFYAWLPAWFQSLGIRMSSSPALLPVRLVSLLSGFWLLVAVFASAQRLGGLSLGVLGVVLVSISLPFLASAHLARRDIMASALGFSAIALHVNNRLSRTWMSLLSGLCVYLAIEFNPYSMIYALAIVGLYFLYSRWSMLRKLHFWGFLAGLALGLLLYAALHILRYPKTYFAIQRLSFANTHVSPILTADFSVILEALRDAGLLLVISYHVLIPIVLWAIVSLAKRHAGVDKVLLVLNMVLMGGVILLIRNKVAYYAVLFTPALDLMVGAFLLRLLRQTWKGRARDFAGRALVGGLCVGYVGINLMLLVPDRYAPFQNVQAQIDRTLEPDDSIMAAQTYWFGLHDHVYYSWEQLIYYQQYAPGSTLENALAEFRPDILILDPHIESFISDKPLPTALSEYLRLPRSELETFLDRQAELIGVFYERDWGEVRIYRITWTEEGSDGKSSRQAQFIAIER